MNEPELDVVAWLERVIFTPQYVGKMLRERREAMGWTLHAAVNHVGMSRSALQRLENGETTDIVKIQKYAEKLGYTVHLEFSDAYADVELPTSRSLRLVDP